MVLEYTLDHDTVAEIFSVLPWILDPQPSLIVCAIGTTQMKEDLQ